jgi:hypothetical protein
MAYEESLRSISLNADSTLAVYTGVPGMPGSPDPNYGNQYRFVKVTGANQVGLATADADAVIGVLQSKPQVAGQAATVAIHGVSMVLSGGAIDAGDAVGPDSKGRAVTGGTNVRGIALAAAGGENELVPVLLQVS